MEFFLSEEEMKDIEKNNHSKIRKLVQQSILWTDIKKHKRLMTEVSNIRKRLQILTKKEHGCLILRPSGTEI